MILWTRERVRRDRAVDVGRFPRSVERYDLAQSRSPSGVVKWLLLTVSFVLVALVSPRMWRHAVANHDLVQFLDDHLRARRDLRKTCLPGRGGDLEESRHLLLPELHLLAITSLSRLEAAACYEEISERRGDPSAMYFAGVHYEACGEVEAHLDAWRQVEHIDAFLLEKHREGIRAREPRRALDPLILLTQLFPDNASYHMRLGALYRDLGDVERSIKSFQQVLNLEPDDERALYELGMLYGRKGWTEEAILTLCRAVASPGLEGRPAFYAYQTLAKLYWANEQLSQACVALGRAMDTGTAANLEVSNWLCQETWYESACPSEVVQAVRRSCPASVGAEE